MITPAFGSHYENTPIQIYWEFYHRKNENFQMKNSDSFHISAHNIDCGYSLEPPRRGGSSEYPHSMFLSRNKKTIVYKRGLSWSKPCRRVFVMPARVCTFRFQLFAFSRIFRLLDLFIFLCLFSEKKNNQYGMFCLCKKKHLVLAHLSRRLTGELKVSLASVVVVCRL